MFLKYYNFFDIFFYINVNKSFFYYFSDYKILEIFNKKSNFEFI